MAGGMLSLSAGLAIPGGGTWLVLPARDGVAPAGLLLEATPSLHPDIMSGTLLIPSMLLHGSLPVGILAVWFGDGAGGNDGVISYILMTSLSHPSSSSLAALAFILASLVILLASSSLSSLF